MRRKSRSKSGCQCYSHCVPADASVVPVDPNLAGLLAGLKQRLSARRSLGGLLADKAAKRAGNRYRKREDHSRPQTKER